MKLSDLLRGLSYRSPPGLSLETDVKAVVANADKTSRDSLFLAMPSVSGKDIRPYVQEAFEKGALAILCSQETADAFKEQALSERLILLSDMGRGRAHIAAKLNPGQPAHIAAVTGTNGKTSAVHFFAHLCQALNKPVGTLGTLGVFSTGPLKPSLQTQSSLTSPDPFVLHEILHDMSQSGIEYLGLEASSHGLEQKRLAALDLEVAAFTNLSHDHLDYHGTLEAYFKAKESLFSDLLKPGFTAVINMDDAYGVSLERLCRAQHHRLLRYGRDGVEIKIRDMSLLEGGQRLDLDLLGQRYCIEIPLIGAFQASNVLCALGMALGVGCPLEALVPLLSTLKTVPGRLELIGHTKKGGAVFVDYAHTPEALESVLTSLKPHVKSLLSVVFGCGGDRDMAKRPLMGHVARRHAQRVYVTDDNPRNEEPSMIRREILTACPDALEIGDRFEAIERALHNLGKGSICVIAGKGHETGQIVGKDTLEFDDRCVVRDLLRSQGGRLL